MPLVDQELETLPEHPRSPWFFHVAHVVAFKSLFLYLFLFC